MIKVIVDGAKTKVMYDSEKRVYTKTFNPDTDKKLKYILGMRTYPGENFKKISDFFNKNGIRTPKILEVGKFKIVTQELEGILFRDELHTAANERKLFLLDLYIEIVAKIINLGVYFGDFNFGNFIVSNNDLWAIDLEDYRKDFFSSCRKKSLLKRLKRFLLNTKTDNLPMNGQEIYDKILKKISS